MGKIQEKKIKNKQKTSSTAFFLSLIFFVQSSCFYFGLSKTSVSHGTSIANLLPFFVLILAHFFIPGDCFTLRKGIGVTIGFLGVLFLFLDNHQISNNVRIGDLTILTAVSLWACNAIFAKKIIQNFNPFQITWYPMIFSLPLFFIGGYFWDPQMIKTFNISVVKALFFQSIVMTSFGFVAWNHLLRKFGATSLHSFVFLMPLSGVFFGVLLLDEPVTKCLIISITLIVSGIIFVNKK